MREAGTVRCRPQPNNILEWRGRLRPLEALHAIGRLKLRQGLPACKGDSETMDNAVSRDERDHQADRNLETLQI
jgi:hypothetical protein